MSVSIPGRLAQRYDPCNPRGVFCFFCCVGVGVCVGGAGGGYCGKEKHFAPSGTRIPILRPYSPSLVTVLTEVSGLFIGNQSK
jgi:hypothetical protein